jgi:hypothetical protein
VAGTGRPAAGATCSADRGIADCKTTDVSSRFGQGQNADRLRRLKELHDWRSTADRGSPELSSSTTRDICLTQHTSIETQDHDIGRAGVVIPPRPTKLYGRLRRPHTGLSAWAHRYPIVKKFAIKKPDRNTEKELNCVMQITVEIASLRLG